MKKYKVEIILTATVFAEDRGDLGDTVEDAFNAPVAHLNDVRLLACTTLNVDDEAE